MKLETKVGRFLAAWGWALLAVGVEAGEVQQIPRLARQGTATQLIVDGRPFLALAGEVHNSSSSSLDYMKPIWPKLAASHVNTVLAPVSWELIEPTEGQFDFSLVDGLIDDARRHDLRLVLLWFGSWKNLVSSYAPVWVRADPQRFACAVDQAGNRLPILSTFSEAACEADSRVFAALMRHIREIESTRPRKTVLMIQVQNEVGLGGGTRDHSPAANQAFAGPVPRELMAYLIDRKERLALELRKQWEAAGAKASGTWEEVFGAGPTTNEIFMAWNYARYVGRNIVAGKAEYPLPMFVNASVGRQDGKVGTYPSGGPVAYVTDVWRAGAPQLDMLCPDIYYGSFSGWCEKYTAAGNPLFIPEMRAGTEGVIHALTAIGQHDAIGVSPFGVESRVEPGDEYSKSYQILSQLAPLILEHQGRGTLGFAAVDAASPATKLTLGRYIFNVDRVRARNVAPENPTGAADTAASRGYALVIGAGPDEFFVAGRNVQITFSPHPPAGEVAAAASIDEGAFVDGKWIPGRRLNGDEIMLSYNLSGVAADNHTGTGARFNADALAIYRIKLIRYPSSRAAERDSGAASSGKVK